MRPNSFLVLIVTLFFFFYGSAFAQMTDKDRLWLEEKLIKPEAQLNFILSINTSMLDPQAKDTQGKKDATDFSALTDDELKKAIEETPLGADGYIYLNRRLQAAEQYEQANEILSLGLDRLLKALDAAPANWALVKEVQKLYRSVHRSGKAKKIAAIFLQQNPENVEALLEIAKVEILSGDFDTARARIDTAYTLAPRKADVYQTELLYQLNKGQQAISQQQGGEGKKIWPVETAFLAQAIKDNPDLLTPRVTLHGLRILQGFYSSVLNNLNKLATLTSFQFTLEPGMQRNLLESKNFFESAAADTGGDHYFRNLCLLMAEIIENDIAGAEMIFAKLQSLPSETSDLYRLMAIGYLSKAQVAKSIACLSQGIEQHDNSEDRIMLAKLYQKEKNYDRGFKAVMGYKGDVSPQLLIQRIGYGFLSGEPTIGIQLYHSYSSIRRLWSNPQFVYYAAVAESLKGNKKKSGELLQSFPKKSRWHASGEEIRAHFLTDQNK